MLSRINSNSCPQCELHQASFWRGLNAMSLWLQNSKNPIQQMIYEAMTKKEGVLTNNYQEAIQRVLNSDYAFIGESISQDLAVARHCNLVRAVEVVSARGFGIATPQGKRPSGSEVPNSPRLSILAPPTEAAELCSNSDPRSVCSGVVYHSKQGLYHAE